MCLERINPLRSQYSGQSPRNLVVWTLIQYDFEEFISPLVMILPFPRNSHRKDILIKLISRKPQKPAYSKDVENIRHLNLLLWSPEQFVFLNKFCAIGNKLYFLQEFFSVWWTNNFILFHFLPYSFSQILSAQSKNSVLKTVLLNTITGRFTCRDSSKYIGLARKGQNNPLFWQKLFSCKIPHFSLKIKNSLFWNSGSNTSQSLDMAKDVLGRIRH